MQSTNFLVNLTPKIVVSDRVGAGNYDSTISSQQRAVMRPYFVVRNSLFGLAIGIDRKDRRATTTFEALPGQDCAEGVVVALPKCDNATGKPTEAEAEADQGESHHDDSSEAKYR